jgi:hypothetical protein
MLARIADFGSAVELRVMNDGKYGEVRTIPLRPTASSVGDQPLIRSHTEFRGGVQVDLMSRAGSMMDTVFFSSAGRSEDYAIVFRISENQGIANHGGQKAQTLYIHGLTGAHELVINEEEAPW